MGISDFFTKEKQKEQVFFAINRVAPQGLKNPIGERKKARTNQAYGIRNYDTRAWGRSGQGKPRRRRLRDQPSKLGGFGSNPRIAPLSTGPRPRGETERRPKQRLPYCSPILSSIENSSSQIRRKLGHQLSARFASSTLRLLVGFERGRGYGCGGERSGVYMTDGNKYVREQTRRFSLAADVGPLKQRLTEKPRLVSGVIRSVGNLISLTPTRVCVSYVLRENIVL